MKFITPMWHPNSMYSQILFNFVTLKILTYHNQICLRVVYPDGKLCISILHSMNDPMYDFEGDARWRPVLGVEAVLLSVMSMLNDPNIESAANVDASI